MVFDGCRYAGLPVEGVPSVEDRGVVAGMTLGRRHEADPTVAVLLVVREPPVSK